MVLGFFEPGPAEEVVGAGALGDGAGEVGGVGVGYADLGGGVSGINHEVDEAKRGMSRTAL